MTVKGGRFINLGTESYSIDEFERLAESGRDQLRTDVVMRSAEVFVFELNRLLKDLAANQLRRKGDDPSTDFNNYEAIITPDKAKTINGKRRIISVDVKVVRKDGSTDFNLFDLLDAGYPRKRIAKDKPMTFPIYDGPMVEAGGRQSFIKVKKVSLSEPVRFFRSFVVGPLPARNFYSRIRNSLTKEARQAAKLAIKGTTPEELAKIILKYPKMNFYAKDILDTRRDRKLVGFTNLLVKNMAVKIKLRGGW